MISFLHFVFCCLTMCNVSAGKIVQGIIGRNVSFSWTFRNIVRDAIHIKHNVSLFLRIWPSNNYYELHEQTDRIRVVIDETAHQTVTVTVNVLNITINDGGMYRVIRQWTSEEFNDSVLLQTFDEEMIPKITIHRRNILYSTLVLECRVSGTSTGEFRWRLNGSLIENNGRYSQNDTFLVIRNLTVDDQYNFYKCMESGSGLYSNSYNIEISGPNTITFAPNIRMIQEHSGVSLSCLADCYPICTWKWTKLDREKVISARKTLYIQNITRQGSGKYSCRVENKITGVSLENVTSLDIVYGPDAILFNSSDKIIQLDEGDSITISCNADCFPSCQIAWTESHADFQIPDGELKLVNNTRDGNYTCRAMNPRKDNTMISDTIYVIVKSGITLNNTTKTGITSIAAMLAVLPVIVVIGL